MGFIDAFKKSWFVLFITRSFGPLCGCGARMKADEPVREDAIIGGGPMAKITTIYRCPACTCTHEMVRLRKLSHQEIVGPVA